MSSSATLSARAALLGSPLGELCRRRRDVTLVLLPPLPALDERGAASPRDARVAAELERRAREALGELETVCGRRADLARELWWQAAPGVRALLLTAAWRGPGPDLDEGVAGVSSLERLRLLARHLLSTGWAVVGADGPQPGLVARRRPLRVRARALRAGLEVDVVTDELRGGR